MTELNALVKRNCKVFFKDKGMFFTSLITPIILLVLYVTFLAKVYNDSFASAVPEGLLDEKLISGTVGAQLISSLLAVCCVTVAFCSNLLMVQDKISGARRDLTVSPVKSSMLSLSYFIASALATLIISYAALGAGFLYLLTSGWYLSLTDVLLLMLDVFLLVLFGTALSSVINCRLSTNGQGSAVGTIVSAGYGFICGAYMPISNFPSAVRTAVSFLPGTYGTALLRNHALNGVFREMSAKNYPDDVIDGIKNSIDCNIDFFGNNVGMDMMYVILVGSVIVLIGAYVLMNYMQKAKR